MSDNDIFFIVQGEFDLYVGSFVKSNVNLFSSEIGLLPNEILYIIKKIELKLHKRVTDIFRSDDCNIMTVENISRAIAHLC